MQSLLATAVSLCSSMNENSHVNRHTKGFIAFLGADFYFIVNYIGNRVLQFDQF